MYTGKSPVRLVYSTQGLVVMGTTQSTVLLNGPSMHESNCTAVLFPGGRLAPTEISALHYSYRLRVHLVASQASPILLSPPPPPPTPTIATAGAAVTGGDDRDTFAGKALR